MSEPEPGEDSVPAGGSLARGGRVEWGEEGVPVEGQPGVKCQSPGGVGGHSSMTKRTEVE